MSRDTWERLAAAALRKAQLWEMFHDHSRSPTISSISSDLSSNSSDQTLVQVHINNLSFANYSLEPHHVPSTTIPSFPQAELRLVRCPKCASILPFSGHPIYRCGGCGTVLRDSNQTVEQKKANVTLNGHAIPDRLVKKAEKLAGPIQPGDYWYDFRAGFWGVMGGCALGMIPPFIEEFNYPMPVNCAGGNTGIFVNGRELHQRDLDLLHGRGLPTNRDKSYTIEMSGRVLDEQTGEEHYLGKLAPSVEKVKRGFGMRLPRFVEAQML